MDTTGTTVIIDVSLNQQDARTKAEALNKALRDLKDAQTVLTATGQKNSVQYKENALAIQKLQQETKAYINLSNNQNGSINQLRAQIALLTNQYNGLSKAEREGTATGKLLAKQLKDLTDQERAATQAAGNFKSTIGNYREEIVRAGQDLLPFGSQLGRTIQSVKSMGGAFTEIAESIGAFSTALAATGIGALILGVASLATYMRDLDTVTDTTTQLFDGLKASFGELGRSILSFDFKNLYTRIVQVGSTAAFITDQNQKLEDSMLAQSIKSAEAQAEVAKKRAQALNHALDPKERQQLLAESEKIDAEDLAKRESLNKRQIELAQQSITLTGNLTKFQIDQLKARGVDYALYLQNNLVKQGKVTDAQTKQLAKALDDRTKIEGEYTQRSEKRNNLSERIALQAEAKAKERQAKLDEIAQDRLKSELNIAAELLTVREKEFADINYDIDKRKKLYVKYGQDTTLLERERLARIATLNKQFQKEDLAIIQTNLRQAQLSNIKSGSSTFGTGSVQRQVASLQNLFDIQDVDKQIKDLQERIDKGEKGLTEVMEGYIQKRKALVIAGNADELKATQDLAVEKTNQQREAANEQIKIENDILQNAEDNYVKRQKMNDALAGSYESLFSTISDMAGKTSTVGKVAFGLEKAFAIARIIINAEIQKSEIATAAAKQAAFYAGFGPFGTAAVVGILAAAAAEEANITAQEITSVATIAAQTVATLVTGKAKGGLITGPGTGTSDSIPARLSNGESVMTAQATKMFGPILSDMNVAGGGVPFATGGIAGTYVPNLSQDIRNDNAITRSIMSGIAGMRPVVYVEDINTGQSRMQVNVENGNF